MRPVKIRLELCKLHGALTVSDLSHWLERHHATIDTWLAGREPMPGPRTDELLKRIELLEQAIKDKAFPLAASISAQQRPKLVRQTYAAFSGGVPANHLAKRRA